MRCFVTNHAIDRASQRLLTMWQAECPGGNPGLHSWLLGKFESIAKRLHPPQRGESGSMVEGDILYDFARNDKGDLVLTTVSLISRSRRTAPRFSGRKPHPCRTCGETMEECVCP